MHGETNVFKILEETTLKT